MGFLSKSKSSDVVTPVEERQTSSTTDPEKGAHGTATPVKDDSQSETLSENAQPGVKAVQAITTVWSKWQLIAAYVLSVHITDILSTTLTLSIVFGGSTL